MYKKVILVHGFFKTNRDMMDLKKNLEKLGYQGIALNLPLTFHEIQYGAKCFENKMDKILNNLSKEEKVSLVGHSTGGLIIRTFLSNTKQINKIHRAILISTPNEGCQLAELADKKFPMMTSIFKTLKTLTPENVEKLNINHRKEVEIGVIAGNKSDLLLRKLIKGENDGRVELYSTQYANSIDSIVLPLNHNEIHHQFLVAQLIDEFLRTGKFSK
ncbi:alpha/beta fold hydrolase [Garciella nitratireducens]|uniref:Alpha/beta hydrolase family protein n=1 Tax=Garciella nitratireducens DSM 15102 TaxID=1121911 RepID=A0A1T4PDK2_9FIRM|nr:alpha/beta fold hydrolase [Garciella nitratireducens]RBP36683.1 putative serine esterase DUF676 [Garciella nitratireducens]SJZ89582.1 Alpha/beta hydrolase family protein [Garciella nitratireducens DSM 15102]